MNSRIKNKLGALSMLVCMSVALAEPNSQKRAQAFAKLPDWSGLWEQDLGFAERDTGAPLTPEESKKLDEVVKSLRPQLNPELEALYQTKYQAVLGNPLVGAEPAGCSNQPMPIIMSYPGTYKFMVAPEETAILHTKNTVRHIYTDGRSHPAKEDLWPTPTGDSTGHWEGGTLVIDTVSTAPILSTIVIVPNGVQMISLPLSKQVHFTERLRMIDPDHLEDQMTMDDPISFLAPWQKTYKFKRVTDFNRMIYEDCSENERNPIVNGKFTTIER